MQEVGMGRGKLNFALWAAMKRLGINLNWILDPIHCVRIATGGKDAPEHPEAVERTRHKSGN